MNIFVLWQELGQTPERIDRRDAAARLHRLFAPFFDELPSAESRSLPGATLATLELEVKGFVAAPQASDGSTWAYAPQYPVNAASALRAIGAAPAGGAALPALARELETRPHALLRELAPPFALMWAANDGDATFVQTDGLGHAMLYEYRDENVWALTNRPFALSALGITLEPDADEWAVRAILGWFPAAMTGFRNLRYVAPGAQLRVTRDGITETRHDVLVDWLTGPAMSRQDSLDLDLASLVDMVDCARTIVRRPYISVSGGRDSRAVLAAVVASGMEFDAKVRGPEDHRDVIAARRLAAAAGFPLEARHSASLPPADRDRCRERILGALRWQAGGRNAHKHKTFQADGRFRDGGAIGFSGQHGEIGRSSYFARALERGDAPEATDDALLALLTAKSPSFMRPSVRARAVGAIREVIRQADRYDLAGVQRWNFLYLFERTRRWAATAQATKPGFSLTPFLNAGYVRAAYAYPGADMSDDPFHRHIVGTLQPGWLDVPYADEIAKVRRPDEATPADVVGRPRWQRPGRRRFYDTRLYWEDVAAPILADALDREGFWTELFDPVAARRDWREEPDELAVVCLLPDALALASGELTAAGASG